MLSHLPLQGWSAPILRQELPDLPCGSAVRSRPERLVPIDQLSFRLDQKVMPNADHEGSGENDEEHRLFDPRDRRNGESQNQPEKTQFERSEIEPCQKRAERQQHQKDQTGGPAQAAAAKHGPAT
jgi:hypothetical protein